MLARKKEKDMKLVSVHTFSADKKTALKIKKKISEDARKEKKLKIYLKLKRRKNNIFTLEIWMKNR